MKPRSLPVTTSSIGSPAYVPAAASLNPAMECRPCTQGLSRTRRDAGAGH